MYIRFVFLRYRQGHPPSRFQCVRSCFAERYAQKPMCVTGRMAEAGHFFQLAATRAAAANCHFCRRARAPRPPCCTLAGCTFAANNASAAALCSAACRSSLQRRQRDDKNHLLNHACLCGNWRPHLNMMVILSLKMPTAFVCH